jgi:hypothetical protein
VAAQLIVTCHPTVRDVLTPLVQHLQALLGPRVILHLRRDMACLAPWLVPGPVLGQGQAKVEQGMIAATDVAHEDAHLAVVDLAAVPAPLTLDPDRVRAALREAAGIKGDDAIGFAQLLNDLSDQYRDQRAMIPGSGANEVLDDLALDIDEGGDGLGILAIHVGQQPLEIEMHGVRVGCGLQRLSIGHHELAQTIHHLREDVGGHKTIAQYFLSPLCPRGCHLFASSPWLLDRAYGLEAIDTT